MRSRTVLAAGAILWMAVSVLAAEVGAPLDVAPGAKETRSQTWASVAWCEGAKCWLAAWREGYLNELTSDIWCARVSADGKALDPAGIRLTSGDGLKDRPRVASDGKGFLVVWEVLRPAAAPAASGGATAKDWDVVAARVSGDGKPLDEKGFLVAGGEHNQCRPDVAFAKGNYFAVWMGFENGAYGVYGTRVSPEGRPLDAKPAAVAVFDRKNPSDPIQAVLPVVSANRDGELLSAFFVVDMYRSRYLGRRPLDAATGQPTGSAPSPKPPGTNAPGMSGTVYKDRTAALALGPGGAVTASRTKEERSGKDFSVALLSKTGEAPIIQELGSSSIVNDWFKPLQYRPAVVFDGKSFLLVSDCLGSAGDKKKGLSPSLRDHVRYARILGWRLSPDGKVEADDGFAVAGEAGRECLLPAAAAGPDGASLVVYSEVRGADDVKVLARVVK